MLLASIRLRPALLADNKEAWLATKYAKTTINFSRGFSINADNATKKSWQISLQETKSIRFTR